MPQYNGKLPDFSARPSPTQADPILEGAGFKKGSDGIYADAQGHKLNFKVTVPGDYSDYVQDLQIAQQNLQAAGIGLTLNKVSDDDFRADRASHNFDLLMTGGFFGPTPYYYLEPLLNSTHISWAQARPTGRDGTTRRPISCSSSMPRPSIPLLRFRRSRGSPTIMADKLPVIPVLDAIQFFEYTTVNWTGWPTPAESLRHWLGLSARRWRQRAGHPAPDASLLATICLSVDVGE